MMPGLTIASLEETHTKKKTDKLEPVDLIQELELCARDSLRRSKTLLKENQRMAAMMPGLMTASLEETRTNKKTEAPEPVDLIQESELNARDSHRRRRRVLLNLRVHHRKRETPMPGLMTALKIE